MSSTLEIVPNAETTTQMICGYCSTGCSLEVRLQDGAAVDLAPTVGHSVNRGMACPKGWEALTVLDAPDRATTPLLKTPGGSLESADWDTAIRRAYRSSARTGRRPTTRTSAR